MVSAPLVVHGVKWLVALAVVGAVVAATATTWLPGAHPVAGGLLLLATPVWLYGLNPTETTLALGCISAAMAGGRARRRPPRLSGSRASCWARERCCETNRLSVAPGLLYARHLTGASVRAVARTLAGVGAPLVLMAAVDQWWFDRPMLAHLRHAVPGFDPSAAAQPRTTAGTGGDGMA